ncbi:AraC family transcriptional regulator [Tabrizicola sp.]|uniref:AraC family transcriptional regulator n=1 Tax=Tabrizicola sp. TaxID=2005166 RepID=UPI00286A40D8|nr:AraC family transcriptional regulator [Tabrizicola sp.]
MTADPGIGAVTHHLLRQITALAVRPGLTLTAHPDVWIYCADAPVTAVRGYAEMMNIAVAASGRKTVRTGLHAASNDPAHVLFLPGGQRYLAEVTASPDVPYISLKLQFSPLALAGAFLELADAGETGSHGKDAPPLYVDRLTAPLAEAVSRLITCLADPVDIRTLAPLHIKEILQRFLRSPAASHLRAVITGEHLRLQTVMRRIEAAPEARMTVDALADLAGMSPSNFAHRFRQVTGVAPIKYMRLLRLERARLLLLDEGTPIGVLADRLGYASTPQFSRDFSARFGLPPTTYARRFAAGGPRRLAG